MEGEDGFRTPRTPPPPPAPPRASNRSTGQDAAAVIKKQLQLLIPDIKIFLDVRRQQSVITYSPTSDTPSCSPFQ